MNPTNKKLISLFLVFSLMMLSLNLYAKKRQGINLLITKRNGQQIGGELITVKRTSLLLLNTDGKDESIDIADIRVITIVKKSKVGKGALTGIYVGGGLGFVAGILTIGDGHSFFADVVDGIILIGLPIALIGSIIGGIAGTDKTIQLIGMTDLEKREVLGKLRKKARIRNYK